MKLISEALEDVKFLAEEDDNGKKNYKIKGIFMQGNIKNRNGRVYPTEVLENCLLYTSPSPRDTG